MKTITPETEAKMLSLKGQSAAGIIANLWIHAEKMERDQNSLIEQLENCCKVFDEIEKENTGIKFRVARQIVEARYNSQRSIQKIRLHEN